MRPGYPAPFSWSYTTDAPPADADGNPQHRTLRARLTLPEVGRPPFPVAILVHGYTGFMDWGLFPVLSRERALQLQRQRQRDRDRDRTGPRDDDRARCLSSEQLPYAGMVRRHMGGHSGRQASASTDAKGIAHFQDVPPAMPQRVGRTSSALTTLSRTTACSNRVGQDTMSGTRIPPS